MAKRKPALRFRWTQQCQRLVLLLHALGHSDRKIARCLICHPSTVSRHLGPRDKRPRFSAAELRALFEHYDAWRNVEEVLTAESGSTLQARLRTSHRLRKPKAGQPDPFGPVQEEDLSDEQLRREVEALVGRPFGRDAQS